MTDAAVESAGSFPDPRAGAFPRRLLTGFLLPFRALGYMFEHPRLWIYALLPILISLVLLVVLFTILVAYNADLVNLIWQKPEAWYWQILWWPLYVLIFASAFVVGAVSFPAVLAAPFNDALSEKAEGLMVGTVRDEEFKVGRLVADIGKTIFDELVKVSVLLAGHLLILPLLLIPLIGQLSYPVVATSWTILWLSAEYLEYPMSRNRFRFQNVRKTVRGNLVLAFGFGGGIFLFLMIPLLNFLFVPVAVVAGTMLYTQLVGVRALVPPPPESVKTVA